jgi:hypothetical protein
VALSILTEEKSEVIVNSVSYQVTIPSLKELAELQKKMKVLDEIDHAEAYQDFFAGLGLPKAATERFGAKHWKMLIEEVTATKKG